MLSLAQIQEEAEKAGKKAARQGSKPLKVSRWQSAGYPAPARRAAFLQFTRRIPYLGTHVPEGWIPAGIDDIFVDSTGLGSEGESALTVSAFERRVSELARSGDVYGLGIVEAGEFQVYVRVYRPDPRDFTRSGNLTTQELEVVGGRR